MRTALVTADRYRIFAITCPFALTNREGRARTLSRFLDEPDAGSYALFMEHIATAINPRQGLMGGKRLAELLRAAPDQAATLAAFQARLDAEPAAVYDVRRVLRPRKDDPDRLANAVRYTVAIDAGTRADMRTVLAELAAKHDTTVSTADRHERVWIRQRDGQLPDLEWCYVIAPGVVPNKIGPGFDEAWEHAAAAAMTRPRRTALC